MRFRIVPLEERVVLDAAGALELLQVDSFQENEFYPDVVSSDSASTDSLGPRVLVISSDISNPEDLIIAAKSHVEVVYYDAQNTSLKELSSQISQSLSGEKAQSIAFANHGSQGSFELLPGIQVNKSSIGETAMQRFWLEVSSNLHEQGRVDLLACNLARSPEGLELIEQLESITESNFAASTDLTGQGLEKSNWILETDGIHAALTYFDSGLLNSWQGSFSSAPYASEFNAGHALSFDGIDDHITVPHTQTLYPASSLSVEAWIQPSSSSKGDILHNSSYSLTRNGDGSITASITTSDGTVEINSQGLATEQEWTHVASTYDGNTFQLYIDGELAGSTTHTGSLIDSSEDLFIGARFDPSLGSSEHFEGQIDEIRLWGRSLDPQEILENKTLVLTAQQDSLIAYWRVSDSSSSEILDYSANNHTGNLQGSLSSPSTIEYSNFDSSRQGWTTAREDGSQALLFSFQSGGNTNGETGDGYLSTYDLSESQNFFIAPSSFTGNLSTAYQGTLSFDMRQTGSSDSLQSTEDIFLTGNGLTLTYDIEDPNIVWSSYSIPIDETGTWTVKSTGLQASAQEMQGVLKNLESLKIRAEFRSVLSVTDLDNVKISTAGIATPSRVHSSAPIASFVKGQEDSDLVLSLSGMDPNGASLNAFITELPTNGTLFQLDGAVIDTPQTLVSDPQNRVIFQAEENQSGAPYDHFGFLVHNGSDSSEQSIVHVKIEPVNDAPFLENNEILTLNEGEQKTIDPQSLHFMDDHDSEFLTTFILESVPSHGSLQRSGVSLDSGDTFSQADIDRGRIQYVHDDSETTLDQFTFRVQDGQGATTEIVSYQIQLNRINDIAPSPGGDAIITDTDNQAFYVTEDTPSPDSANVRLTVPVLEDGDSIIPEQIRILEVVGGTLLKDDGSSITFGENGSRLDLVSGHIDFRFSPDTDREEDAFFHYVVVDPDNPDPSFHSQSSTALIPITPVNDTPVMSTAQSSSLSYAENSGAVVIDASLTLSDQDNLPQADDIEAELHGATISINDGYQADQDHLLFSDAYGITGSFDNQSGVLTLSGIASTSDYTKALRSVSYYNNSENPEENNRTIQFSVHDAHSSSNLIEREISVSKSEDAPTAVGINASHGLMLDGINDIGVIEGLNLDNTSFTISTWVEKGDQGRDMSLFSIGTHEENKGLSFGFDDANKLTLTFYGSSIQEDTASPTNQWMQVTATFDSDSSLVTLYRDGVQVAQDTLDPFTGTGDAIVGANAWGGNHFKGSIDELRVYTKALSNEDIQNTLTERLSGDEEDLAGYWRFDEGKGSIAEDHSLADHHLHLGAKVKNFTALATSTFEQDLDGWSLSIAGDSTENITHQESGGHGGGYLSIVDPDGTWSYWQAPQKFLNDQSESYGGSLQYSLKDQGSGQVVEQDDVLLIGNGLTLAFDTKEVPQGDSWQEYIIPLLETAGWINKATGIAPTKAEMISVLESLDELKIRGEFYSDTDTLSIDSVLLSNKDAPFWIQSQAGLSKAITIDEHSDVSITLGGVDLDQSPLQAKIGKLINLFQYSSGSRGLPVTSANAFITDPLMRTIFGASTLEYTTFSFQVSDDGTNFTNEEDVDIHVLPVNHAPEITLPGSSPQIFEDTPGIINGISISDEDIAETPQSMMTASLNVEHGQISLAQVSDLSFLNGDGFKDQSMIFRGTLENINEAIDTLTYTSFLDYNGQETLHIQIDDEGNTGSPGALQDMKTLVFDVQATNDRPVLSSPVQFSSVEDEVHSLSGIQISDLDILDPTSLQASMQVTLSVDNGTLSLNGGSRQNSVTLTDTLANLNAALATLDYQSDLHFTGKDSLQVLINDLNAIGEGDSMTDSLSIDIAVDPSNDAPALNMPADQVVLEDKNLILPPIIVSDPLDTSDNAFALYEVSLSASHGTASLFHTHSLSFSQGSGVADKSMTFRGTLNQVNEALSQVLFRADSNYHGQDTLFVSVNDLGNTGQGNSLSISDSLNIEIQPVDDPYVIEAPTALAIEEGAPLSIPSISISDVDLIIPETIDPASIDIEIDLFVEHGLISMTNYGESSSIRLSGNLEQVNQTLATLTYQSNSDFKGSDHLVIHVLDENEETIASNSVFLTIDAVNDAPILTLPGSQTTFEETPLNITGASIFDIDVDETINGRFRVTLEVSNGTLHLNQSSGLIFSEDKEEGRSLVEFTGTPDDVNAAIASIEYRGNLHFNGEDTLSFTVNDLGNSGLGGPKEDFGSIAIEVQAVNDAPVLTASNFFEVDEDQYLSISDISISDIDIHETENAVLTVSLSASHGNLELSIIDGLSFESGSNDSHSMTFTGSLDALNTALSSLRYRSDANFNGPDNLSIVVNDRGHTGPDATQGQTDSSGALFDSASIEIHVSAINDAPTLSAPSSQTVFEETPTIIEGLSAADLDVNENASALLVTTLQVNFGTLAITDQSGVDYIEGNDGESLIRFQGSLEATNNALAHVEYTGNLHYHSAVDHPNDTLSIHLSDRGNTGLVKDALGNVLPSNILEVAAEVDIPIEPVNDAPTLSLPDAQTVSEDTDLILNIDIDDRDISITPDIELEVTLSVDEGTLTLSNLESISFTVGDGVEDSSMIFKGTVPALNQALESLKYRAGANYHGPDLLSIDVSDLGKTGQGNVLTEFGTIAITVDPINDQPIFQIPEPQSVYEDSDLTISGIQLNDADTRMVPDIPLEVTLEVSHGVFTLNDTSNITFTEGDGNKDKLVIFQGTVPAINAALNDLTYRGDLHYHDDDLMTLHVSDLGNISLKDKFGVYTQVLTDSASIPITLVPVNDEPVLEVPEAQEVQEEQVLAITGISLDDRDIVRRPDIQVEVNLSVDEGKLSMETLTGLEFIEGTGSGEKSMTFRGTLPHLNAALSTLSYVGDKDYHGPDTLSIHVDDLGQVSEQGEMTPIQDSKTVSLTVIPVNDAPFLEVPGQQTINEDTDLVISGIHFDDRDIHMDSSILFEASLSVSNGTIHLNGINGLDFQSGSNGQASMVFKGTLNDINQALNDLVYRGNLHYHDQDRLDLFITDLGNISPLDSDGNPTEVLTDSATIDINVVPVNDAPLFTVPGLQNVNEDTALTISGISLDDRDIVRRPDIELEVLLKVTHGTILLNDTSSVSFLEGDNGQKSMRIRGTVSALNAALNDLSYQGDLHFHDTDQLELFVTDLGNVSSLDGNGQPSQILTDTTSIDLIVVPINDSPTLNIPDPQVIREDSDLFITGVSIDDRDLSQRPDIELNITLSVEFGTISLNSLSGLSFTNGDGVDDKEMTFTGKVQQINTALSNIKYRGDSHYHGPDSLDIHVDDQENVTASNDSFWGSLFSFTTEDLDSSDPALSDTGLSISNSVSITVDPVNDLPTLTIPESQTVDEDKDILISGFSIDDRDVTMDPSIEMEVTLSAEHGVITLDSSADLNTLIFDQGDGTSDPSVIFRGTVEHINQALNSITYRGDLNYHGEDQIKIKVDDQGNLGEILDPIEGAMSLNILSEGDLSVEAINDPAEITLPEPQQAVEEVPHAITGISITDPDILITPDIQLEVTLSVNHGLLSIDLNSLSQDPDFDVIITQGFGAFDRLVSFKGTLPHLNSALNTLVYRGDLDYNLNHPDTPDVLTVQVNDLGNTGRVDFPDGLPNGVSIVNTDQLLTTAHLNIEVEDVNDAPILTVPQTFHQGVLSPFLSVNEDEVLNVHGIHITDVDVNEVPDAEMEVSLSVQFGTLSLNAEDIANLTFLPDSEGNTSDGSDDKKMVFRGSLENINNALDQLTYQGDLNYNSNTNGNDSLEIKIDDLGNTGSGGNLIDESTIEIEIVAVNDQPHALDVFLENIESPISGYTVIGRFETSDVDLEDVGNHTYTLLEEPHTVDGLGYKIDGDLLLINNKAFLSFDDANPDPASDPEGNLFFSHEQEIVVRTNDNGDPDLSYDQRFFISDRTLTEAVQETVPTEAKVFVNPQIATAATYLKGVLSIEDWANEFDNLSATQESEGEEPEDPSIPPPETPPEAESSEEEGEESLTDRFSDLLRDRSTPGGSSSLF